MHSLKNTVLLKEAMKMAFVGQFSIWIISICGSDYSLKMEPQKNK